MISRNFILCLVTLFVTGRAIFAQTPNAQQWNSISVEDFSEILGTEYTLNKAVIAPNGVMIAWVEPSQGLCLYVLANQHVNCHTWPWPDDQYMSSYTRYDNMYFYWSSDSRYIALAQEPFRLFYDSDIWIFDVSAATFSNLTEDNFTGMVPIASLEALQVSIDYLPTWNTHSSEVYYFNTSHVGSIEAARESGLLDGLRLYRVTLDGEDRVLVRDFSNQFLYYVPAASISSDGRYLAFFAWDRTASSEERQGGIWLLDLTNDSLEQVVNLEAFFIGMPGWLSAWDVAGNTGLQWVGDDQGLVVAGKGFAEGDTNGIATYHYVNLLSKTVVPLIDMSSMPLLEDMTLDEEPAVNIPFVGFLSHDGDTFHYVFGSTADRTVNLASVSIAPTADFSDIRIYSLDFYGASYYGFLFRLSEQNQVLLDGRTLLSLIQ
jgi:hypothetical protein